MNILHYTIGLPPLRHGGSVQYAHDLMAEQATQGHKVFALTCGDTLLQGGKVKFKRKGNVGDIEVYALADPLTPTLIYGVSDPVRQHRECRIDYGNIEKFVRDNCIDVLHIHTFQGLHKDVVEYVKSLGVTIVYTSHDFHGICPHYNLIDWEGRLCDAADPERCERCNRHEPSELFLRIANSSLYHALKSSGLGRLVKKQGAVKSSNDTAGVNGDKDEVSANPARVRGFESLLQYYKEYFRLVDKFHFNSSQTREKFEQFLGPLNGEVIPVVTSGIRDKRRPLEQHDGVTLGFVGSLADYKGFPMLKSVMTELYKEGVRNIKIKAYGGGREGFDGGCPLIEYMPPYRYAELSDILYHLDGTIVPSKWYETFSLVTLESLAHGRPVICSDHVGAKDVVAEYNTGFIFDNKENLRKLLKSLSLTTDTLMAFHKRIMYRKWNYSVAANAKAITEFYQS